MSLVGKALWTLRHPAFAERPVASLARLAVWRVRTALGLGTTVPVGRSGLRFWCPPEWRGNAKLMYVWGNSYERELAQLHRWVRAGDLVVDVGAHYGCYTLPLAQIVADGGEVVAMEPARHARRVLSRNLSMNNASNVRLLPFAAGDKAARADLHLHTDRSRASLSGIPSDEATGTDSVEVVRLDDVLPGDRRVSFIKFDVEGFEAKALEGSSAVLTRDRPVVVFEYAPSATIAAGLPAQGAWDLLKSHGYRMHRVTDRGDVLRVDDPATCCGTTSNIVAIHPDQGHADSGR
ncbi:FkbM family methyltransferase [Streptomyces wuyuanensis]|uniref:FkbM family methyltransferase n=1 Tax=Streptomyces wuyuanensis TaxID=1196353 RepID=UPI00341C555D